MPIAMTGNRIVTTTRAKLMPKVVDTVLNSNVFATIMLNKAKAWSGNQMQWPVKLSTNTTATSFSGFDTFSTSATNNRDKLTYNPSFVQISSVLPLDEMSVNAGSSNEEKILDLAALTLKSDSQDLADYVGTMFYGDGTGNTSKDSNGLANLCDDGTIASSIGGLSRSTYTTLQSTVTASGGTLTLAKMSTLYNAISSGSVHPDLGVTTEGIFSLYEALLTPQLRMYVERPNMSKMGDMGSVGTGMVGGYGFTGLYFKGFPVLADEKASSYSGRTTPLYFLNTDFLQWYALPMASTEAIKYKSVDIEGNDYADSVDGLGFSWSGWIKPTNQAALIGHVYLGGQLITDDPKRLGVLTGISGV